MSGSDGPPVRRQTSMPGYDSWPVPHRTAPGVRFGHRTDRQHSDDMGRRVDPPAGCRAAAEPRTCSPRRSVFDSRAGWLTFRDAGAKLDTMNAHVTSEPPYTVLFDADCGLCVATAGWLRARVPAGRLRTLPLGEAHLDARLSDAVRGRDLDSALHVVRPDGSVRTGAAAVLAAGRLVPRWGTAARAMDHRVGHALLEPIYRLVAQNRVRIGRALGLPATCAVVGSPVTRGPDAATLSDADRPRTTASRPQPRIAPSSQRGTRRAARGGSPAGPTASTAAPGPGGPTSRSRAPRR